MTTDEKTNILVVDDLDEKLLVYKSVLEELDQNLVVARSGEEALGHVLRTEFAVILLDVEMPGGMNGFETAQLIRKRRKSAHTPIIFLTAFVDEVRTSEGYARGAVDFVSTPVVPEILRAKVRVFVDLYRMTQQVKRQAEERVALVEERSRREAAEETSRRLAFLARAGAVLGNSLDHLVTARDVARLPIPALASRTAVALKHPRGGEWTVVQAEPAPDGPAVTDGTGRDLLPAGHAALVDRVLAGDTPDAPDDRTAVLPLKVRGKPFGAMLLVRDPAAGGFGGADLTVAEALASRAAIALENARLYQDVEAADRQKNEFLSMLAHELRNPLAPLQNAAEVIRLKAPDQPQVQWARAVIDRQLAHMVRLIDDLLDVSRITRGKIRLQVAPVNLADVIAQAVEASRPGVEKAGHQLELALPPAPVWVNGDSARLAQVVTNLLNNATKYTEPGGRIWLTLAQEDGIAVVRVRDTGVGIPADMLASVFDLFTQVDRTLDRAQGGLGIGLTLVHRLVTKHGGTVSAHSDGLGAGSEFVIRLPTIPAPAAAGRSSDRNGTNGAARRLTMLLVDDNVDGAESLATLLRLVGHEVRVAHDGPAGIEAAAGWRPDVVVLDIGLPGMSGYEVARHLRTRPETQDAVLVAATGYGRDEDRKRSREAGFDHHLVKPVDLATLRPLLDSISSRLPAGRAAREP
jgi:signal transduction histidine kinase/DNA-binding response OmpR family regulator